jgi:1,4-dihydroxy-2-naphthoyl-CoA synthase
MKANPFKEILYEKKDKVATITINRPERYNACLPTTIDELAQAFIDAWTDKRVYVVVFTGAGDKAFCTGGDQSARKKGGYHVNPEEHRGRIASLPLEVGWQLVTFLIRTFQSR